MHLLCSLVKVGGQVHYCTYCRRFLQAPRGTVTVDGHDICDLNIDWWRQQITYVSQHPHIMKGTLREVYPLAWM